MIDEILRRHGLTFEDLRPDERQELFIMVESVQKGEVTVESIRRAISSMRSIVERELVESKHDTKQDILLKARLKNYILLESIFLSPEHAKEQLEKAVSGMSSRIKTGI
mgnify:CR=1 FL=1